MDSKFNKMSKENKPLTGVILSTTVILLGFSTLLWDLSKVVLSA